MSVKKIASGRRAVRKEVDASVGNQTAATRRVAEAGLRTLINQYVPAYHRLIAALRKSLRKRLQTAYEIVYEYANQGAVVVSFSPNEHGYEGVVGIRATADGVRLYFTRGKELPDPAKLLQGSSQTRFLLVEGASTLARPEVASLIDEAIARNRVPFAEDGRGSVLIRSTSAQKQHPKKSPPKEPS